MSLNITQVQKPKSNKVSPVPAAEVQLGVIVQVIDLGVQPGGSYKGEAKPDAQKIWVTYELPNDTHDFDGETKPLLISEDFTFSGSELSTCYKRLNGIDPGLKLTGGDLSKLVGMAVQVMITHREGKGKYLGRTFANVAAVSPLMRGMKGPDETYNPQFFYTPSDHNEEIWSQLPDFLKAKIEARLDAPSEAVQPRKAEPKATPQAQEDDAPPFDTDTPEQVAGSDEDW